ncbi:MAG: hypothetical protein C0475_00825 [Planctomyces sp.]|nr:hypothetical protein [Planctomyces sp.]
MADQPFNLAQPEPAPDHPSHDGQPAAGPVPVGPSAAGPAPSGAAPARRAAGATEPAPAHDAQHGDEQIQLGDRPDLEAIERFRAHSARQVQPAAGVAGSGAGQPEGTRAGGAAPAGAGPGGEVAAGPFIAGAWPQPVVLAVVVGAVAVLAMVFAGLSAVPGSGFLLTVGRIGATVFGIAVYTSVGVAALACTAWAAGLSVGKLERAAGVMGVAVAGFFAVSNVPMPWGQLGAVLALGMGAGAYWLALVAFVRRPLAEIHTVALIHVALAVVIYLGTLVTGLVRSAEDAQRAENAAKAPKPPAEPPVQVIDLNRP